jgi:hypothetical protein
LWCLEAGVKPAVVVVLAVAVALSMVIDMLWW